MGERPTGQPLYQYQLTEGEYVQLKAALQQQGGGSMRAAFDQPFCAAFCLFCAEWFRREYTGGWSWRPIWEVLGYKIDANNRAFVVNKGLQDF